MDGDGQNGKKKKRKKRKKMLLCFAPCDAMMEDLQDADGDKRNIVNGGQLVG